MFLNLLADSIANAKIPLLVNYPPEYSHQWSSKIYYAQLWLDLLAKESADEMLTALLASTAPATPSAGAGRDQRLDIHAEDRVRAQDLEALKQLIREKTSGRSPRPTRGLPPRPADSVLDGIFTASNL